MAEESVRVAVRVRPHAEAGPAPVAACVRCPTDRSVVVCDESGNSEKAFTFDFAQVAALDDVAGSQASLFDNLGKPLVQHVTSGYNISVFAYGQTGSGKSFTMYGPHESGSVGASSPDCNGLIPRFCAELFSVIQSKQGHGASAIHTVEASYFQIYNEKVNDLCPSDLNEDAPRLRVREDPATGPYVEGLSWQAVQSYSAIQRMLTAGNMLRAVAATNMNASSSRSHAVFTLRYKCTRIDEDGSVLDLRSKVVLVDLAGSERAAKTGAEGARLREAGSINKSLSALGMVIAALAKSSSEGEYSRMMRRRSSGEAADSSGGKPLQHIPYRESVLTWLLKDTLGGNAKTLMIATVSPAMEHLDETVSTLRYAERAKMIKNVAVVNEDPNVSLIRQLREEITMLKSQLAELRATGSGGLAALPSDTLVAKLEALTLQNKFQEQMLLQLHQEWQSKVDNTTAKMDGRDHALREMGMQLGSNTHTIAETKDGSAGVDWQDGDWGGQLDLLEDDIANVSGAASAQPYLVLRHPDPQLDGQIMYSLRKGETTVGAAADNTIRLASAGISAHHLTIRLTEGQRPSLHVEPGCDVWVNGTLVNKSDGTVTEMVALTHGDRIVCGRLPVVLHYFDPDAVALNHAGNLTASLISWETAVDEWKLSSCLQPLIATQATKFDADTAEANSSEDINSTIASSPVRFPPPSTETLTAAVADVVSPSDTKVDGDEEAPFGCHADVASPGSGYEDDDGHGSIESFEGQLQDEVVNAPLSSPRAHPATALASRISLDVSSIIGLLVSQQARAQEAVLVRWCDASVASRVADILRFAGAFVSEINAIFNSLGASIRLSRRVVWVPPRCGGKSPSWRAGRGTLGWDSLAYEQDVDSWGCGVCAWLVPHDSKPVALGLIVHSNLPQLRTRLYEVYDAVLCGVAAAADEPALTAILRAAFVLPFERTLVVEGEGTLFGRAHVNVAGMDPAGTVLQSAVVTDWGAMIGTVQMRVQQKESGFEAEAISVSYLHLTQRSQEAIDHLECRLRLVSPTDRSNRVDAVATEHVIRLSARSPNTFATGVVSSPVVLDIPEGVSPDVCGFEVSLVLHCIPSSPACSIMTSTSDRWSTLHAIPVIRFQQYAPQFFSLCDHPLVPLEAPVLPETMLQLGVMADMLYFKAEGLDRSAKPSRISLVALQPVPWQRCQRDPVPGSGVSSSFEPVFNVERLDDPFSRMTGVEPCYYDSNRVLAFALSITQYDVLQSFQLEGCAEARITDVRRINVSALGHHQPIKEMHISSTKPHDVLPIWQHRDPEARSLRLILPIPTQRSSGLTAIQSALATALETATPNGQRVYVRIQLTMNIRGCTIPVAFARWVAIDVRLTHKEGFGPTVSFDHSSLPPLEFSGFDGSFILPPQIWAWYQGLGADSVATRLGALVRRCGIDISRNWTADSGESQGQESLIATAKTFIKHGMRSVSQVFQFCKPSFAQQPFDTLPASSKAIDNPLELYLPDQEATIRVAKCELSSVMRVLNERAGYLMKRRARLGGWVRRWFVLQSPFLLFYHAAGDFDAGLEPTDTCHLSTLTLADSRGPLILSHSMSADGVVAASVRAETSQSGVTPLQTATSTPEKATSRSTHSTPGDRGDVLAFQLIRRACRSGNTPVLPSKEWVLQASSAEEKDAWVLAILTAARLVAGVSVF